MPHIPQILADIRQAINESPTESIPFRTFMELALYGSDAAYYRQTDRKVGRHGDFYTSVSVGKCFGLILAEWITSRWTDLDQPARFSLIEQGAHDGQLMVDILDHLQSSAPECYAAVRPVIIDPYPTARQRQHDKLSASGHLDRIHWSDDWDELRDSPCDGVVLCNELLDAFPVDRIQWSAPDHRWMQVNVASTREGDDPPFTDHLTAIDPASDLAGEIARTDALTGSKFPDGYQTEVLTGTRRWLDDASAAVSGGSLVVIDYGFSDDDYYHASRSDGTLRTYFNHQALDDPFQHIGDSDITAHVNFSALARHAIGAGITPRPLTDQGKFLIDTASPWLIDTEQRGESASPAFLKLVRQLNTLTHPANMGSQFKVLVIDKP